MKKTSLFKLLKMIKKYIPLVVVSLFFALISTICILYIPILIGDGIDLIVEKGNVDFAGLNYIIIKIVVFTLISTISQWLMNIINNLITYNVMFDLRVKAFRKIHRLPLKYLDNKQTGDIVNRIINDVDLVGEGLLLGFSQFFVGVLTICGTLMFMITINFWVSLIVVLLTPISLFVAKYISSHTHDMFKKQSEIKAEQTAFIDEMITNQKIVHAYNLQEENQRKFDLINNELEKNSLKAIFFSSLTNPCTRFVNNIVYAAVALSGALFCLSANPLSIGGLSTLLSYANQYTKPFNEISGVITELQNALASFKRIDELLVEKEEVDDKFNLEVKHLLGRVDLNGISFSYTENRPLIKNLTLEVPCGKKVAIVGPTGCGKTTLINLLLRFYDVNSGTIDGIARNLD